MLLHWLTFTEFMMIVDPVFSWLPNASLKCMLSPFPPANQTWHKHNYDMRYLTLSRHTTA